MKKNSIIELYRLIAVLIIMTYHLGVTGIGMDNPFAGGWTYVEFFLFLTGFLTCMHFGKTDEEQKGKAAVGYCIKKFKSFYLIGLGVTFCMYTTVNVLTALNGGGALGFVEGYVRDFIAEIFLVTEIYSKPAVAPLWYLYAIIVIFPLFCLFIQMKDKYTVMIMSVIVAVLYYGFTKFQIVRTFPWDYVRVLAGLCVGAVIYYVAEFLHKQLIISKCILNIILLFALLFPVVEEYFNKENGVVYLICHMLVVAIAFNKQSFASGFSNVLFDYAGKISMPLFIVHWYIGTLVSIMTQFIQLNRVIIVMMYYVGSIIAAVFILFVVDKLSKRSRS